MSFDAIVRTMKSRYDVRVRRWRKAMSGCAWSVYYHDGKVIHWVESPKPKTPLSLAIFLHEVGHHAIGFKKYKVRCEEEYHVWQILGIVRNEKVRRRRRRKVRRTSLRSLDAALRRSEKPSAAYASDCRKC